MPDSSLVLKYSEVFPTNVILHSNDIVRRRPDSKSRPYSLFLILVNNRVAYGLR